MVYHILSYLERACAASPDKIALADAQSQWTYRQLRERVAAEGSAIAARLQSTGTPVAVYIRHDAADVLHFLSIAYSGNFYIPVDPALPADRIRSILDTVRPAAVILREGDPAPTGPAVWDSDALAQSPAADRAPWRNCKDTDLLYVIFTSGSTGAPKGVAVRHRSVIDMAEQFCATFQFGPDTVFGNQAPFDFDVSVKDIYLSLKVGGRLEILEKKLFSFPRLLLDRLNERQVNTAIWAVPALKILATLNAFKKERPRHLKNILFSGEVMPPKTLAYLQEKLPDARLVNLYGPTEITCNCTYHPIDRPIPPGGGDPHRQGLSQLRGLPPGGGQAGGGRGRPRRDLRCRQLPCRRLL